MGRAPCCDKENVKRGPWSPEEDAKLKNFIEKFGIHGSWIALPQKAGLKRCGKSCRLRWLNYLRPNLKHGEFSDEEDRIICSLYMVIGSRWSIMAAQLPGRTDNDIKNYWNTKLKKKLMGTTMTTIPSTAATIHGGSPVAMYPSGTDFITFPTFPDESLNFPNTLNFSGSGYQNFYHDGFTVPPQSNSCSINPCFFGGEMSCSSSEGGHYSQINILESERIRYFEGFLPPASMDQSAGLFDLQNSFDFWASRYDDRRHA